MIRGPDGRALVWDADGNPIPSKILIPPKGFMDGKRQDVGVGGLRCERESDFPGRGDGWPASGK